MNRMEVSLENMIKAFNICLKTWNVDSLLKVEKTTFDQRIRFSTETTYISRERAKIVLKDGVIVKYKTTDVFMEAFGAVAIEFHADWAGIRNKDYTGSLADMSNGTKALKGGEGKIARIIDEKSNQMVSISFQDSTNISDIVNRILDNMSLMPVKKQNSVNLDAWISILDDLKSVVASVKHVDKQKFTVIIERIENLIEGK